MRQPQTGLRARWPPLGYDPAGFFVLWAMDRITFLIDGFNLYHSVREAERHVEGRSTRWLDIRSLCASYLHLMGREAVLQEVHYFSALAKHLEARKPDVTRRHRRYIECIQDSGVRTALNRFKKKNIVCPNCGATFTKNEEKETDVAIAVAAMRLLIEDACDTIVFVTGDTDVAPAVRAIIDLFPAKRVLFAFPYRRKNKELAQLSPGSFTISKEQYCRHQFRDPYVLRGGRAVHKPANW